MDKKLSIRDNYIDIVKAIGIISIVIGHCCWKTSKLKLLIGPFVYSYHLMIFMFISGYLFNYKKYFDDEEYKYKYIGNQFLKMSKIYFMYNLFFCLLHNIFVKINIIDSNYYTIGLFFTNVFNGLTFSTSETLLCAFWFIPVMLIAKIIFSWSLRYTKNKNKYIIMFMILFGMLGILLCYKKIVLSYRFQISILSVFFMYLGLIFKKMYNSLNIYIYSYGFIPASIIIYLINYISKSNVELSVNEIINPILFFVISIVGIYFCLSLAKVLSKLKNISKSISIIGKNSLHIMALHFLIFKIIDVLYSKINNINNTSLISNFPKSYSLCYLYIPLGVIIPIVIINIANKMKNYIMKKIEGEFSAK
jgi:fucose 4-O-acetylase-like acetyltransferase